MEDISRRRFIQTTSVGIAAATALVVTPLVGSSTNAKKYLSPRSAANNANASPVVAHVVNAKSGEIRFFVGEHEIVRHDKGLANQILNATNMSL